RYLWGHELHEVWLAYVPSHLVEIEHPVGVAAGGSSGKATRWQFDHERGRPGKRGVLPTHRAARVALQSAQRQFDEPRKAPFDLRVSARFVDQPQALVEPDRDTRPQFEDELVSEATLGLGERSSARVVDPSDTSPAPGE